MTPLSPTRFQKGVTFCTLTNMPCPVSSSVNRVPDDEGRMVQSSDTMQRTLRDSVVTNSRSGEAPALGMK